ncbi:MAG TPA: sulfite exporter TauE/SafE family protein [Phycisphaerae bacterium]|nr:sulfite exporter TauE/SafE family protein [Phycisphaerae bacterium]
MAQFLWLVPLGAVVGVFGTLIGAGGGFVLMPILLVVYPQEKAEVLTFLSLVVVFFNAFSGSVAYARMGRIDYRAALLFSAAAIPGAVLGAMSTAAIPRRDFDVLIGLLLVAAAVLLSFRAGSRWAAEAAGRLGPPQPPGATYRTPRKLAVGAGLSTGVGFVSSLLGIGGGIIHVPVLVEVLGFPIHVATATSHLILAIVALAGVGTHVVAGTGSPGLVRMAALVIGVVVGAQGGAALSNRVTGAWIMRGLALALALVGLRLLLLAGGH